VPAPALGRIDWRPALDHLALLAPPTRTALLATTAGWASQCFVAPIDPDLADTSAFCAAYDVPMDASANCVVVSGRRAETLTMAACMVLATDRADVNKVVRKHLDVRKISFAPMADAVSQSGMEYGGITPIGLPADWPVLVDEAVAAGEWMVIGSGIRGSKLAISGAALAALPTAQVLRLAQG
jgi:prolyl-tRNA editing enzyme YbaK/EbsC (Cys-tRNA(Pro) deacylase)